MLNFDTHSKTSRWILISAIAVAFLALIGAIGVAVYFSQKYNDLKQTSKSSPSDESKKQALIKKVKKLYDTPTEEPSIVRVDDKTKINSQEFFKKAENEDIVFVYKEAKLAILYRESTNKIINTGPISLDGDSSENLSEGDLGQDPN